MNILVVYQHYYPEPFRIKDLCESLVKRGHRITVLTGLPNYPEGRIYDGYRGKDKREELLNGVQVIRCYLIPRGRNRLMLFLNYVSFTFFASLTALRLSSDFDVVFAEQTSPVLMTVPAIVYKKKHGKKMLLYCLDPWPDSLAAGGIREGSFFYRLFWPISKWIYASADRLMVSSFSFIDYFVDTFSFDRNGITYLPQYAEELFDCSGEKRNNEQFNLVFAGNVGKAQSVETIIRAANELKDKKDIRFHIIGSGSDLERCQKLVAMLKLDNVLFYGRRPLGEMPGFYKMADAMLITLRDSKSFSSTLPGKVQSYMAAGKAIIGAANGETRKVISEAECGICCAAEDYIELSKAILEYYKTKNRELMGLKARTYYENNFSKEQFMITLEKALTELGEQGDV
jgi:glycosyltransferase involved in cell wall biosynthesis